MYTNIFKHHFAARDFYDGQNDNSLHYLLRPNLIIYLDASVDAVMKKIAARGNEWDKNSPVYGNATFLNDCYTTLKKEYLAKERYASSYDTIKIHNTPLTIFPKRTPAETE